jgi:hypothetical protein
LSAAQAVPSVLPPEGLNLGIEVDRYRNWLIDQALLRCGGSYYSAAALLHTSPSMLYRQRRPRNASTKENTHK